MIYKRAAMRLVHGFASWHWQLDGEKFALRPFANWTTASGARRDARRFLDRIRSCAIGVALGAGKTSPGVWGGTWPARYTAACLRLRETDTAWYWSLAGSDFAAYPYDEFTRPDSARDNAKLFLSRLTKCPADGGMEINIDLSVKAALDRCGQSCKRQGPKG